MCEAKSNLKRKLENEEEVENKGFNIDGDMAKSLEHFDHHTKDLFQSTKEVLDENLPIIYNSLETVKSFISLLGKIIKKNSAPNRSNFQSNYTKMQGMPFTLSPKLEPNITTRVTSS